jgi:single-strand DNA-binding protein
MGRNSLNSVTLVGKVVGTPKARGAVTRVLVNSPDFRKDPGHPEGGEWVKNPVYVYYYGKESAQMKAQALKEGDRVMVNGELDVVKYVLQDANGQKHNRSMLVVRANTPRAGGADNENEVRLVGRVGKRVEIKFNGETGSARTYFSVATDRWDPTANDGKGAEVAVWTDVVLYGKRAESAAEYLKSGKGVIIIGKLETYEKEDVDGKKYPRTYVKTFDWSFAPGGGGNSQGGGDMSANDAWDIPDDGYGDYERALEEGRAEPGSGAYTPDPRFLEPKGGTGSKQVADLDEEIPF